jgi:hypothetical protein
MPAAVVLNQPLHFQWLFVAHSPLWPLMDHISLLNLLNPFLRPFWHTWHRLAQADGTGESSMISMLAHVEQVFFIIIKM